MPFSLHILGSFLKKHRVKTTVFGLTVLSIIGTSQVLLPKESSLLSLHPQNNKTALETNPQTSLSILLNEQAVVSSLPIQDIQFDLVPGSQKTVLFFPQIHITPGTDSHDATNNQAEQQQRETLQVLNTITASTPLRLVMLEGEMEGPVEGQKLRAIQKKLSVHEQMIAASAQVTQALQQSPYSSTEVHTIQKELDKELRRSERELLLLGAPYLMNTNPNTPIVYTGAEQPTTMEKSRILVREHLYLQDRLAQVRQQTPHTSSLGQSFLSQNTQEQLLQQYLKHISKPAPSLVIFTEKTKDLKLKKALDHFISLAKVQENTSVPTRQQSAPSRANNPYASLSSAKQLQELLTKNEQEIKALVLEQRNKETAENARKLLEQTSESVLVLQYGAKHEEGLRRELLKQGMSVVTVKTNALNK